MKKAKDLFVYRPKALIPGYKIEAGLEGLYVAVPDRAYKGHPFVIQYWYPKKNEASELVYGWIELKVPDWNRAVRFRRFMDKWGRGAYTLAYFKVADKV